LRRNKAGAASTLPGRKGTKRSTGHQGEQCEARVSLNWGFFSRLEIFVQVWQVK